MKSIKKAICIFAALLIIISAVACGTGKTPGDSTGALTGDSNSSDQSEQTVIPVPDIDTNGRVFTVLCTDWASFSPLDITDVFVEEDSDEAVSSAAYRRELHLAERFRCSIERADINSGQEYMTISTANRSGDMPYDVSLIRCQNFFTLVSGGALLNLDKLDYSDFSDPWWNTDSYDTLSVLGYHFGVTSDFTVNDELATWVIFFNKEMIKDNNLESPYDLVSSGAWTMDKEYQMAKTVAKDVDNDGMKYENDIWGIEHIRDNFTGMLNSCGVLIAKNNSEGVPEFSIDGKNEIDKILHIFELLYDTNVCINMHVMGNHYDEVVPFMENRVLFFNSGVYQGSKLRAMDTPYGIIPMPKYNETQDDYLGSSSGLFVTLTTVPREIDDHDGQLSAFIEEYTRYGYDKIRPAFYGVLLERKIAYDDESAEMLKYIFDRMIYDPGLIGNYGQLGENLIWMTNTYDSGIASFLASKLPQAKRALDKMIRAVEKYE